uniref:RING-H2 finger protein ATL81-like n=1 Tax=Elaeis guineensis var. tenera TaxID=51953 RepID=A0A6I9R4K4_ELAGV|nr:RING-H2 finger protein ATL81-like [Elaeis guineensis]
MTMLLLLYFGVCLVYAGIILASLVHFCMAGEAEAEKSNERGLTVEELEKMEEGKMAVVGGRECAVCLEEMAEGRAARVLPGCCHAFHRHCVDAWLQLHPVCPILILEVRVLDLSITMSMMMDELLKNDLKKSLIKIYPRDYPDMLVRAEKHAHTEEIFTEDGTPIRSVVVGGKIRSASQGGRRESINALDFYFRRRKMGPLLRNADPKALREGIGMPLCRGDIQTILY